MRCTVVRSRCVRAQVTGSRGTSFHTRAHRKPRCGPFRGGSSAAVAPSFRVLTIVHPGNRSLIRLTRTPGATGETSAGFGERTEDWLEEVEDAMMGKDVMDMFVETSSGFGEGTEDWLEGVDVQDDDVLENMKDTDSQSAKQN
eukprot:3866062-Pyramimonas_sp.AAC.1